MLEYVITGLRLVCFKQPKLKLMQELIGSDLAWMADLAWIGHGVYCSPRPHREHPVWHLAVTPGAHSTCLETGITPSVCGSSVYAMGLALVGL